MSDSTDRVLASIDEAIDDYVTWDGDGDDALSWVASPAEPFDEAAWLQDGYVDGEPEDAETPGDMQVVRICADMTRGSVEWSNRWPSNWVSGPDPEAPARALRALNDALQPQFEAMKSAVISVGKALQQVVVANHPSFARMTMSDDYQKHRARCRLCNPAGNPTPLKVNGAEYRRRTRARRRRNRQ